MKPTPKVYVVDDEAAVRKALHLLLETAGYDVETFASAAAFLGRVDAVGHGCLILDVRMPDMDGMQLLKELAARRTTLPIIMLSAHGDIPMAVDAMHLGAFDFVEKPADPSVLRQKVAAALAVDEETLRSLAEREEIEKSYQTLTPREQKVLELLIDGKSAKTVAKVLGVAHSTIRVQRASILKKMGADSATDLLKMMTKMRGETGT